MTFYQLKQDFRVMKASLMPVYEITPDHQEKPEETVEDLLWRFEQVMDEYAAQLTKEKRRIAHELLAIG